MTGLHRKSPWLVAHLWPVDLRQPRAGRARPRLTWENVQRANKGRSTSQADSEGSIPFPRSSPVADPSARVGEVGVLAVTARPGREAGLLAHVRPVATDVRGPRADPAVA